MNAVWGLYNYWIVIFLMMTGFYILIARDNLVKKIIGLNIFQISVFLLYITMGKREGGTAPILPADVVLRDNGQPIPPVGFAGQDSTHGVRPVYPLYAIVSGTPRDFTDSDLQVLARNFCLAQARFSEADIEQLVWNNPVGFFAQSGRLDVEALNEPARIDRRDTWTGNSVLRGQNPDRV